VLLKKPVMIGSGASGPTSTSYGFEDAQTDSTAGSISDTSHDHHDQYDSERERSSNNRQQQQSVDNKFGGWSETANQAPRGYEGGSSSGFLGSSSGSSGANKSKQPHMSYYFTIGSVDTFERKLEEAQKALGIKPRDYIPVQYQAESSMLIEVCTAICLKIVHVNMACLSVSLVYSVLLR
jgi:hypothetical protein